MSEAPAKPRPPPAPRTRDELVLGPWRLSRRLGTGPDGSAYLATDQERPVVVHHLSRARKRPERWEAIKRALAKRRLADETGLLPLVAVDLAAPRPWIATPVVERRLFDELPLPEEELTRTALLMALAVSAVHRVGLALPCLSPASFFVAERALLLLDATPVHTAPPPRGALAEVCEPPFAERPSPARDVYALAALLGALFAGRADAIDARPEALAGEDLGALLQRAQSPSPEERPSARQLVEALAARLSEHEATLDADPLLASFAKTSTDAGTATGGLKTVLEGEGRFALLEELGQGAMGYVFRARDQATGEEVALKVLHERVRKKGDRARRRFMKEARLLSELQNPYIANLLEVGFDGAVDWMATELKAGKDLHRVVDEHGPLSSRAALEVLADVARGLIDAHAQGIVHRDIKPANVLLLDEARLDEPRQGVEPVACLLDFGIARHMEQSASLELTRDGGIVGTPMYLAPEQAGAGEVVPASDVYALGATAFHLLTGAPPFTGDGAMELIGKHLGEIPPRVDEVAPEVEPAVADLVARMLAKKPAERFSDAAALLVEIERLLGRTVDGIGAHPRLPDTPGQPRSYVFEWDLDSSPEALWPYVSDTDRLNRAVGLAAVDVDHRVVDAPAGGPQVEQIVQMDSAGLTLRWKEHPFEWVIHQRFGVLREFTEGPFAWLRSTVDLKASDGGGTHLTHRFDLMPKGALGRAAAALEVKFKGRRGLDKLYRRIDDLLRRGRAQAGAEVFEEVRPLAGEAERRLQAGERALVTEGCDPAVVDKLGQLLRQANPKDLAHIRPLAFARRFALDEKAALETCLRAVPAGLLTLHWDLLCPVCKIASDMKDTLAALRAHGHCAACNLDYELDLAGSVELVLRSHPRVRPPDVAVYCASSPGHSPHIKARVRVEPGERLCLDLALSAGSYLLAGRGLPFELPFSVRADGEAQRWDLDVAERLPAGLARTLRPDGQRIVLLNTGEVERVIRVEEVADHEEAFTAARASAHWLFRRLFPDQRLDDGQLVSVRFAALVLVEVADPERLWSERSEEEVYRALSGLYTALDAHFASQGGALLKVLQDGAQGVFLDPTAALTAALGVAEVARSAGWPADVRLRAGVHQGAARAVTLGGRLDYFGKTARGLEALVKGAASGELRLSQEVATDPAASRLLEGREVDLVGVPTGGLGLRLAL